MIRLVGEKAHACGGNVDAVSGFGRVIGKAPAEAVARFEDDDLWRRALVWPSRDESAVAAPETPPPMMATTGRLAFDAVDSLRADKVIGLTINWFMTSHRPDNSKSL